MRAGRIVTADGEVSGTLRAVDGVVAEVVTGADRQPGPDVEVLDVPGDCVLMPGLVDSHVHLNEPGRTEWEGFATGTAAAAAGGVTTVVDMPLNSIPPTTDLAGLAAKRDAAVGQLSVDVGFWGGAVPGNVGALRPLHEAGVVGFKCFLLPSGVPEFGHLDRTQVFAAMREIAAFGGLLIAHAEDAATIAAAHPPSGPSYQHFLASRPPEAERRAVDLLLAGIEQTGCRTHIVHLSSAGALDPIAAARAAGLPLTVETCPHYLTLAAEDVPDGSTEFKCCPPIRAAGNADALWDGLRAGVIDIVVTDHSPSTAALKHTDCGDFGAAWGGIASVQLGLPVVWTQAARRGHDLVDVARWMSRGPARLCGLATKGELSPGHDADFSILAPDEMMTVDPARLLHRHAVTPYAGASLRGVVRQTWVRGRRVDPARPHGRMLTPTDVNP